MDIKAPVYRDGKVVLSDWNEHDADVAALKQEIVRLQCEIISQQELQSEIKYLKRELQEARFARSCDAGELQRLRKATEPITRDMAIKAAKAIADGSFETKRSAWVRDPKTNTWREVKPDTIGKPSRPVGRPRKD